MQLAGHRFLITGGTSGIGLAPTRELTERGAQVAVMARDPERLAGVERDPQASEWSR